MILFLTSAAVAAPRLVIVDGPLAPGRATWVELADDAPGAAPRAVSARGCSVRPWVAVRPGVWRAVLIPAVGADEVEVALGSVTARRAVSAPARSPVVLPETVDALVGAKSVDVPLQGFDGDPTDLQIDVSEGTASVARSADGLVITVVPDPLVHPRWVLVHARDRRTDRAPAVAKIRLRGRPRLPLQVEPGVTLRLVVGGRSYGPFVASDAGTLEGRVDQYPGEGAAEAVLIDSLGNETRTEIPLVVDTSPVLVASPGLGTLPGRAPSLFFVSAQTAVGTWATTPPSCRAPFGDLPLRELSTGTWYGALPALSEPQDVRLVCSLGNRQTTVRVPVAAVPARLALRVWPDDLRADFPTAEVRVSVEDWRGDRLPVDRVQVQALVGHVDPLSGDGDLGRAEYDGSVAVAGGRDRVVATYHPEPGDGPPVELDLGWSAVTPAGVTLSARVSDWLRRPLEGVPVTLWVGQDRAEVQSNAEGVATAVLSWDGTGPIPVGAELADGASRSQLLLVGEGPGGLATSALVAGVDLSLRPGRVSGLDVDIDPPLLRAGPGAVAWVVVRLEDGLGQPVSDEPVTLEVSEGTVGELREQADGSLVAEYQPLPATERREIEITASTASIHSTARLVVEPRVVRYSLGPWFGVGTRFGPGAVPIAGVDLDARVRNPLVGESLIVRASVAVSTTSSRVVTGVGPPADLRSTLVPAGLALLLRDDRGPWSLWGGVGFSAGVQRLQARFGNEIVSDGTTWVVGPDLHGAVARRALGGEIAVGLRGSWLDAPPTDVGFNGNLGGVSATLGYRVVW